MISSEGSGMHADSIAMSNAIPEYPVAATSELMKPKSKVRIFSVMRIGVVSNQTYRFQSPDDLRVSTLGSERPFLGEAEAGQGHAVRRFGDLHLYHWRVRRGDLGGPQHGVLRENFAVNLRDEVILAGRVLTPDLPKLDIFHGHDFSLILTLLPLRLLTGPPSRQLHRSYF